MQSIDTTTLLDRPKCILVNGKNLQKVASRQEKKKRYTVSREILEYSIRVSVV